MATITAESIEVRDPAELPEAFARAFEIFESRRPRPVHIGIPIDVLDLPGARLGATARARGDPASPTRRSWSAPSSCWRRPRRPMLLLGGGAVAAGAEATAVAERLGAPVGLTVNAKGVLPDSHPLSLGTTLTLRPVHAAFTEADVVLAVGTEFGETDYFYAPGAAAPRLRGLRSCASTSTPTSCSGSDGRRRPARRCRAPRSRPSTPGSRRAGASAPRRSERAAALREGRRGGPAPSVHLPFLAALERGLPDDGILVADSTQPAYVAHHSWPGRSPRRYIAPGGFGTLGPALPMAIGAQLAAPGAPWSRWPATAARSSRSPSSRAPPTSGCRSRS